MRRSYRTCWGRAIKRRAYALTRPGIWVSVIPICQKWVGKVGKRIIRRDNAGVAGVVFVVRWVVGRGGCALSSL